MITDVYVYTALSTQSLRVIRYMDLHEAFYCRHCRQQHILVAVTIFQAKMAEDQ